MARVRWGWAAAAAAALGLVGVLTLTPSAGADTGAFRACLVCGDAGGADFVANVLLFAPVALLLGFAGLRPRSTVVLLCALSLAIELVQLRIPGRESTLGDVVANTAGAAAGAALAHWWPRRRRSSRAAWGYLAAALAALAGAGLALRPHLPDTVYFGQWAPHLAQYDTYGGRVVRAELGGLAVPSERLPDSRAVRDLLVEGAPLLVQGVAGPPPRALAPLLSIADEQKRGILLLGVERSDLVFAVSTFAPDVRLRDLQLRWPRALDGTAAGDTLAVRAWRAAGGYCLALSGRTRCRLAYDAAQLWRLIAAVPSGPAWASTASGYAFLLLLGVPAGLLAPRRRVRWLALLAMLAGFVAVSKVVGLAPATPLEVAALTAGFAAGALAPDAARVAVRADAGGLPR